MFPERKQEWQNQNQFLQDRHGLNRATSFPEIIAVALPASCGKDDRRGFDLLCWTINMASRPGDSVFALERQYSDSWETSCTFKSHVIDPKFKPLQDLCDIKQVSLKIRIANGDITEKFLLEQVLAMGASMLVVTTSGQHSLRLAHRRGSFLSRRVPTGCSIVVVKDYKVLYYKENHYRSAFTQGALLHVVEGDKTQRVLAVTSSLRHIEQSHQLETAPTICNRVWPESEGTCSPRRVLDSSEALYDSDEANDDIGLTRSLSKKPLLSCASSDQDSSCPKKHHSCLISILRGRGRVQRSLTFPPTRQSMKRFLTFSHCKSLGSSFKFYMSNLWVAMPHMKASSSTSTAIALANKPCKMFTYEEISRATNLFNPGNLVGKGGHSEVYKGFLDCQFVAVKRLIRGDTEEQKTMDFLSELGIICHTKHSNIIPLVGLCIEKGLHLVFPFLQNGSLASWLHGGELQWATRYRVAMGTARGLNYLHSGSQRRVIHRDIKASNILLNVDFEPQISDFGLAKWLPDQCSHRLLTPIEGTFGYLAPEYFMHGIFNEKTDVFAFGVLLLELITGRKPIEGLQSNLVMWARPYLEAMNVEDIIDTRLNDQYDAQEMQCMMMAAALCVQQSPQCRPSMSQVLQLLADEVISTENADSWSVLSAQSFCLQDLIFDRDYSSTCYQNDMRRHREIALQF